MLISAEEIIKEVKIRGDLGCSEYALVKFVNVNLKKEWSQDPKLQESEFKAV